MRFLLLKNCQHPAAVAFAEQVALRLLQRGHTLADAQSDASTADVVLLFGGDGTFLSNLPFLSELGKPILGINFGKVGYLSSCEPSETERFLQKIESGDLRTEARMLLRGSLNIGDRIIPLSALNEISIHRGNTPKAIRLSVSCGETPIGDYAGDGVIVSTSTGSTAYNLSAGGPVLLPESRLLALTPLCPAKLPAPSLVIPADDALRIDGDFTRFSDASAAPILTMDGCRTIPLSGKCTVQLEGGDTLSLIVGNRLPICRLLQKRLLYCPEKEV